MAAHLRETLPPQKAANVCANVAAGLEADPITQDLAPLWTALTAKGDAIAVQSLQHERKLGKARAVITVVDAHWDDDVGDFARDVLAESKGKRDEPPNSRFFGKTTGSEAQEFGVAREVSQGRAWLLELQRDPAEPLALKWTPVLKASTDALEGANKGRDVALGASAMHSTTEILYVEEINIEIDKLEGELKKRFPRQPKRVAAFLASTRLRKSEKSSKEEDEDEGKGEG